jgi:hypothetical protein
MFQYNPTVNNISGQIYGQGLERAAGYDAQGILAQAEADLIRAQRRHQAILDGAGLVGDVAKTAVGFAVGGPAGAAMASGGGGEGGGGGLLSTIANLYADKKSMETKAKSYDKIGEILGSAMFSKNDPGMGALAELRASEDPREKVMGYEQLFSMLGPMSNMMMANRNAGIRENAPFVAADLQNRRDLSRGKGTYGTPAGMEPVEPDLPPMDSPPRVFSGRDSIGMYVPDQDSMSVARKWASKYFGKLNP